MEDLARIDLDNLDLYQLVVEYVTVNGDWNWERISQILPNDCLHIFMPIKPPIESIGLDRVAWFLMILGDFFLKSYYNRLNEGDLAPQA